MQRTRGRSCQVEQGRFEGETVFQSVHQSIIGLVSLIVPNRGERSRSSKRLIKIARFYERLAEASATWDPLRLSFPKDRLTKQD